MIFRKKKKKVEYTFRDYCQKQISLYESLIDSDSDKTNHPIYNSMISRYELMMYEYSRYNKEVEFMERKAAHEG